VSWNSSHSAIEYPSLLIHHFSLRLHKVALSQLPEWEGPDIDLTAVDILHLHDVRRRDGTGRLWGVDASRWRDDTVRPPGATAAVPPDPIASRTSRAPSAAMGTRPPSSATTGTEARSAADPAVTTSSSSAAPAVATVALSRRQSDEVPVSLATAGTATAPPGPRPRREVRFAE